MTNTQVKGKRYERIELSRGLGNVERVHGLLRLVEILQQILLGAVLRDTIAQFLFNVAPCSDIIFI